MPGYETGRRRQGRRTDADPFQYLQYPELTEQRVGIGVEGDGSGKCGCGVLPRDETDRGNIHMEIGGVKVCRDAGTKLTIWRSRALLSRIPRLCSRGNMPVL